jgi:hypothetical protein
MTNSVRWTRNVLLTAACIGILCLPLPAQTSFGSIVGTITDQSGAIVPGAVVTLTNLGTSERRTVESDTSGNYQFVNLVPGNYRVDIEMSGFKRLTREVQVAVLSTTRVDAAMEVGDIGQTVEVTGQTALLQTDSASVGQVVEGRTVTEMPLNGRNVFNLIALVPGVVPQGNAGGAGGLFAWGNYQISGGMPNQGKSLLDGAPLNGGYINSTALAPAQDTIQEFQVQSNNLTAEFGGTLNGVVNLATKSGANAFHGAAYEYLRNAVLNANTFFSNKAGLPRPAFTQNQFGANVGGRIIRDKTFFFAAYEGYRQSQGTTGIYTMPTEALRNGDFSNLRNASGALIRIYDPLTTCGEYGNPACAPGQTVLRTPFPDNVIPQSRFDKTAAIMRKYWALPNTAGTQYTNTNNYIVNYATGNSRDSVNARIDYNVSEKQRLFGRFTRWTNMTPPSDPYGVGLWATFNQAGTQGVLADTYSFNPRTVLDIRLAYLRSTYVRWPNTMPTDLTTIGWPASYNTQALQPQLPAMQVTGFSNSMKPANMVSQHAGVASISGSLTKIVGRHTIKTGGEFAVLPTNYSQFGGGANTFRFTTNFTAANPNSPGSTGSAFASYLLGLGSGGELTNILYPAAQQCNGGLYVTDTFQATSRLTLNLGLRWEYPGYWTERYDQETVFLPGATNPVLASAGLKYQGDLVLVNSPRYQNRHNVLPHWDLLAPRFGAAYRLNDRTVVRSGFGILYTPGTTVQNAHPYAAPISTAKTPWVATQDNSRTPVNTLNNPFPGGIIRPPGRDPVLEKDLLGTSIVAPIPADATPYVINWNFSFSRQLGSGTLIDIAYVGSRGVHLYMGGGGTVNGPGYNQIPNQYLSLGSQLLTQVANPFYGIVTSGTLAQKTIPYGMTLLPYPQYSGVNSPTAAGFDNIYHSLQMKFQKRLEPGGTVMVSYTWSKNLGNADTMTGFSEAYTPGVSQDYYNWGADRSLITYDVPQRLSVSYVVDLPFGKGKRFLGGVTGVVDKLVSGWGINGVTTLQAGFPIPMLAQATSLSTYFGAGPPRPNVVAGCNKIPAGSAQSRINQWFNTACFSQPSTFGFGNEARTDPNIRTHGVNNFDFTLFKNTPITERAGLQLRLEVFNLFNRVQFGVPGNTIGSSLFGLISSQLNNPRLVQVAARIVF